MTTIPLPDLDKLHAEATREIPGWPGYAADSAGVIWSVASNWRGYGRRALGQMLNTDGYPSVWLSLGGGKKRRQAVHKLVALAFHGTPVPGMQVRHLNGNKLDNSAANLAWGTAKENAADRDLHGRTARGDKNGAKTEVARERTRRASLEWHAKHPEMQARGVRNGASKLTDADVAEIRRRKANGETLAVIAHDYGMSQSGISLVVRRIWWKHVA